MNNLMNYQQEETKMKNRFPERWKAMQRWNNSKKLAQELVENAFKEARKELSELKNGAKR